MQSQHYAAADLAALGREWIAAWNSHDLERILALYAEDAEMTSDRIQALGLEASGTLRGEESLRMYWGKAFQLLPGLHFDLIDARTASSCFTRTSAARRSANICGSMRGERSGRARPIISRISAGIVDSMGR
jgi:ketosteroid isomerase-like protein